MIKIVSQEIISTFYPTYSDLLKQIEYIGRICYKSQDKITDDSAEKFIKNIIARKHFSVLEHGFISVIIKTNRAIANELVRHRIASYMQESTRYCNYSKKEVEFISLDPNNDFYEESITLYQKQINAGIKPENARDVLPLALATTICCTTNIRAWREIIEKRIVLQAHPLMRALMEEILLLFKTNLPVFFEDIQTIKGDLKNE